MSDSILAMLSPAPADKREDAGYYPPNVKVMTEQDVDAAVAPFSKVLADSGMQLGLRAREALMNGASFQLASNTKKQTGSDIDISHFTGPAGNGEEQVLPEIDPSAYSIVVTPIAYTTEADVAAVSVFEQGDLPQGVVRPQDALEGLPEFAAKPDTPLAGTEMPVDANGQLLKAGANAGLPGVDLPEVAAHMAAQAPAAGGVNPTADVAVQTGVPDGEAVVSVIPPVVAEDGLQEAPAELPVATAVATDEIISNNIEDEGEFFIPVQDAQAVGSQAAPVVNNGILRAREATQNNPSDPMGGPLIEEDGLPTATRPQVPVNARPLAGQAPVTDIAPEEVEDDGAVLRFERPVTQQGAQVITPQVTRPMVEQQVLQSSAQLDVDPSGKHSESTPFATTASLAQSPHHVDAQRGHTGFVTLSQANANQAVDVQEQIHVHVRQAVNDGADHISIRLNPPELGKLDIRMEVMQDGRAHVMITADNKDAFDILQRDARGLEKMLNEAGLQTDSDSLQFDLKEHQHSGQGEGNGDSERAEAYDNVEDSEGGMSAAHGTISMQEVGGEYRLVATDGLDITV